MLSVELGQYLEDRIDELSIDLAGSSGNIFVGSMPDSPDTAVMVHPTGGPEASTKSGYATPTVQVMVRGTRDPRTGSDLADKVYSALHGLRSQTLPGGTWVVRSTGMQSAPISLGEDSTGRHEYSMNFRLEIRQPTSHSLE